MGRDIRPPTEKPLERFGIDTETYTTERNRRETIEAGSRCAQSKLDAPRNADREDIESRNRVRCALAWEATFGEPVPWRHAIVVVEHYHLTMQVLTVIRVLPN